MNPYINLRKCEKGDILVLKDGSLAEYVEHREGEYFPHIIKHLSRNVGKGSRGDDGSMFKNNKRDEDLDDFLSQLKYGESVKLKNYQHLGRIDIEMLPYKK